MSFNIRVSRFETRYKLLRDDKHFDEVKFKEDLGSVPLLYLVWKSQMKNWPFSTLFSNPVLTGIHHCAEQR